MPTSRSSSSKSHRIRVKPPYEENPENAAEHGFSNHSHHSFPAIRDHGSGESTDTCGRSSRGMSDGAGEVRIEMGLGGDHNIPLNTRAASSPTAITIDSNKENFTEEQHVPTTTEIQQENEKLWRSGDDYHYEYPNNGKHWEDCMKRVGKFDDDMCKGWKEEIDTLLVFAGLFSGTITSFTIESYQWLQSDPDNAIISILSQVSLQLGNSSATAAPPPGPFIPSRSSVRINIFWFLGLTLSLMAVLVGILCKQWIREYQKDGSLSHREALAVHQMRYEALQKWRVPEIVAALPLLLQLALIFFFAGLLDLLWGLNRAVGAAVTVVIGMGLLGLVVTTVLPALQWLRYPNPYLRPLICAYKSPQSQLFLRICTMVSSRWDKQDNWLALEMHALKADPKVYIARGMAWLEARFTQNVDMVYHILRCLEDLESDVVMESVMAIYRYRGEELNPVYELFTATEKSAGTPTIAAMKDVIAALYIPGRQRDHATSERRVRVINTFSGEVPTELFVHTLRSLRLSGSSMPEALRAQTMLSLRNAIAQKRINDDGISRLASFIGRYHYDLPGGDVAAFLEDLTQWVGSGDRRRRVQACIEGMSWLAYDKGVTQRATLAKFIRHVDQLTDDLKGSEVDELERWTVVKNKYWRDI